MPSKLRSILLFGTALTLGAWLTRAGLAQDDPIVERMRKDVTFLASEECEGRGVGTKGLDKAAEYIAAQFARSGLKPGGTDGTYFQPFPFATGTEVIDESVIYLEGPQGQKVNLKNRVDF